MEFITVTYKSPRPSQTLQEKHDGYMKVRCLSRAEARRLIANLQSKGITDITLDGKKVEGENA